MTFVIVMGFHQIIVVMNDVKRHTYIHTYIHTICLQFIFKRNTNPLKCADIFYFLSQSTRNYYNPGGYLKIQRMEKRSTILVVKYKTFYKF